MNEKQIVQNLIPKLLKLGFIVHRYDSYSTSSIYLKLDYGVSCGIRIADHYGKPKYRYRFNLIKNYTGDKVVIDNNLIRYYYSFDDIDKMLVDIDIERKSKLQKYGKLKYTNLIEKQSKNLLFDRFQKIA